LSGLKNELVFSFLSILKDITQTVFIVLLNCNKKGHNKWPRRLPWPTARNRSDFRFDLYKLRRIRREEARNTNR
jgi:hypothetical protein